MKALTANSLDGQLQQLNQRFSGVEATANSFETLDRKAKDVLVNALVEVYEFGEALFAIKSPTGTNIVHEFLKMRGIFNERSRKKPYIALINSAFPQTLASSRSHYSTVLDFASSQDVLASDFRQWIGAGIEKRRDEALKAQGSSGRARHTAQQQTRLTYAMNTLSAKPSSTAVALPAGVQAREGYALVLAKIDSSNNASIVEVVDDDPAKVEPVLIALVEQPATASSEPLAPLIRAIEMILTTTPDDTGGKARHILMRNMLDRGQAIGVVVAVSEAYSFPAASMRIDGHVGSLPTDQALLLRGTDAKDIVAAFEQQANWKLDASGLLTADGLKKPFQLEVLQDAGQLRIGNPVKCPTKPLQAPLSALEGVVGYLEQERADLKRKNASARQKRSYPSSANLIVQNGEAMLQLPYSIRPAMLATVGGDPAFDDVSIPVKDLEAVATALVERGCDASGWVMDNTDMPDAAIVLETHLDNDVFQMILPTQTGSDYNQVCMELVL